MTQGRQRGLLRVIEELQKDGSPVAENIADHIESMTDYDFAHLLFSDGHVEAVHQLRQAAQHHTGGRPCAAR